MCPLKTTTISASAITNCRAKMCLGFAVLFMLVSVQPTVAQGQRRSYYGCCPPPIQLRQVEPAPSRIRRTYGGRVYYSFPNYDVVVSGAPGSLDELIQGYAAGVIPGPVTGGIPANVAERIQRREGGAVIVKNAEGMRWDGSDFFLHPAYPLEYVTRYQYTNRIVGEPQRQWPEDPRSRPDDQRLFPAPAPSEPTVTQLQPAGPTAPTTVPYQEFTTQFLPAPWVVAPTLRPSAEPTRSEKPPEPPSATSSTSTTTTTSAYKTQPQVKTEPATSHDQGQAYRRALKTGVDCWTTSRWSSPECVQYRQRIRDERSRRQTKIGLANQ